MAKRKFDPKLSRRELLKLGGWGAAALTFFNLPEWAWAAAALAPDSSKVLVALFQRGAADGLNIVPPFNDDDYHRARPTIGMDPPGKPRAVYDLDGRFGLHPGLVSLMPMWQHKTFAVVHAVGSPDGSRSHFEAQDNMETGTPGVKVTPDGWLNRALSGGFPRDRSPLGAVAISARLPRILRGGFPVTSFPNLDAYRFMGGNQEAGSFEEMYSRSIDRLLSGVGREMGDSVKTIEKIAAQGPKKPEDTGFPKGPVGRSFFELSRIIRAGVGLKVGFLDVGGWDHHTNEGHIDGRLMHNLTELGDSIAAFYRSLGSRAGDVLLVTMTEFGRTLHENGDRGTDHGHASVMMLFGGGVKGGKVYGSWPGLAPENLFEGRDLQVTTDFRQVHSEILAGHLGITDTASIFPGFTPGSSLGFLG